MKKGEIMKKLFLTMMLAVSTMIAWAQGNNNDAFLTIGPDDFQHSLENNSSEHVLVDVRTQAEYDEAHLKGAILIDVKDANFKENALKLLAKDKTIMVYCRSGRRSAQAANILTAEGYQVINLKGGIMAWTVAGKETVK